MALFAEGDKPANIQLESTITITQSKLDSYGENFETVRTGFIGVIQRNRLLASLKRYGLSLGFDFLTSVSVSGIKYPLKYPHQKLASIVRAWT
jgi:hypothetical protein